MLIGLVPVLAALHLLTILGLLAIALLVGSLTVLFDVAYQSYLPALVDSDALVQGNALLVASESLSQVAGPGLGGVLVQVLTAPVAVAADASSYAVSVVSLLLVRGREPVPRYDRVVPLAAHVREGLSWVLGHPALRAVAGYAGTENFFLGAFQAVFVLFAIRTVGLTPALLGIVYAGQGVGGLLGAGLAGRVAPRLGTGPTIVWSAVASAVGPLMMPLAQRHGALALPFLTAGGGIAGLAGTIFNVAQVSMRQRITPPGLLGRMNASIRFLTWGPTPLGSLAGGLLGSLLGLRPTLWITAVAALGALSWLLASPLRTARQIEGDGIARAAAYGAKPGSD